MLKLLLNNITIIILTFLQINKKCYETDKKRRYFALIQFEDTLFINFYWLFDIYFTKNNIQFNDF